ncbi:hypothetical protein ABBQ32_007296 [Trebouxia sp. C0010 RCD-2024]
MPGIHTMKSVVASVASHASECLQPTCALIANSVRSFCGVHKEFPYCFLLQHDARVLFAQSGRNLTGHLQGLLAYHIIPGLYDADNNKLIPNPSANNTVDTALSAILTSPQRVNFTTSNSTATNYTSTVSCATLLPSQHQGSACHCMRPTCVRVESAWLLW